MKHLLRILIIAVVLTGCQKEYENIIEPDKSEGIIADDNIKDLILNVVLKDGSFDNLIDRCSEISIKYSYSILINDQLMQISSIEDIEEIYLDYFQYRDDIEIQYPITIIHSDYSEAILNNSDDLEEIHEQYNTHLLDDDIECLDFIYPIEINIYNTTYQNTDNLVANNDADMYEIFQDLTDIILEIDFPIELTTINGENFIIGNNIELENQINAYKGSCDEDDHVEFDDEDFPYEDIITAQEWEVLLYSDTMDETSSFNSYKFNFRSDYTVQASGTETTYGTWELNMGSENVLEIEFDTDDAPFVWLNHDWTIKSISSSLIEMEAESDFDGFIKKLTLLKVE